MKSPSIFILSVLLIFTQVLSAQGVDDRAKESATDKTNQRIDTRIDQGVDKGLDAIEGLFKKKKKKSSKITNSAPSETPDVKQKQSTDSGADEAYGAGSNLFGGMFKKAVWNDKYTFNIISYVTMTETKKNGKQESDDIVWMIGENAFAMNFEDEKTGKGSIIMDAENQSFITLFVDEDSGPTGMALAMNEDQLAIAVDEAIEEQEEANLDATFTKTGRTKEISGYTCSEYTFTDEDSDGVMWVTEEVAISMAQMAGLMSSGKSKHSQMPANYPSGYAMEMTMTDKKKKDSFHYLVTELKENANEVVDTTEYNVQDPMSMMGGGQ